jgi:hypothetical protein
MSTSALVSTQRYKLSGTRKPYHTDSLPSRRHATSFMVALRWFASWRLVDLTWMTTWVKYLVHLIICNALVYCVIYLVHCFVNSCTRLLKLTRN